MAKRVLIAQGESKGDYYQIVAIFEGETVKISLSSGRGVTEGGSIVTPKQALEKRYEKDFRGAKAEWFRNLLKARGDNLKLSDLEGRVPPSELLEEPPPTKQNRR